MMMMVWINIDLIAEHPWQWSKTAGECEAEEREGEEGEVIQERVVAGVRSMLMTVIERFGVKLDPVWVKNFQKQVGWGESD